ncbi:MAG TPA: serine hydrolase [Rhizomicrobium sp.]|nr:serine hydrolase [Rhizomicrobium sp.]
MVRVLKWVGIALGVVAALAGGFAAWLFWFSPQAPFARNALPVGAGVAAQLACGGVYVSGRKLDDVVRDDILRLSPLTDWNRYALGDNAVSVSVAGMSKRTAVYRPGVGCTLLVNSDAAALAKEAEGIPVPSQAPRPDAWPKGDTVDLGHLPAGVDAGALERAVADAFLDETPAREIDTRAIVVVYEGQIVAERYAKGYGVRTRFLSWSMAKSVTAALIGTLVDAGKLDLYAPPRVPEWKWPGDPRGQITLAELLNMSSGLAFEEPYDPGSDSTRMLFQSGDMAGYAAAKPLAHPPGTVWAYSSGTANILSRLALRASGGTLKSYEAYARAHLFDPAGITSAMFEPDESGNFVGSSYLYMTARDWARFGLLFLGRGAINGRRVLSEQFADFVARPAPADPRKGYGAQFWLNGVVDGKREFPHLPSFFAAEGHNDEFVAIFPSRNAVIVRLGWTVGKAAFDRDKHFAAILAALPAQ